MTTLSSAKTLLTNDGTLTTLATGGIYLLSDLGRLGLNRSNTVCAAAFASNVIKPCIVLKLRSATVVDGLGDDVAQKAAQREMMEIWLYDDNSYSTIESMMGRVYVDLHGKKVGSALCRWAFDGPQQHDSSLDAMVRRSDFAVYGMKS